MYLFVDTASLCYRLDKISTSLSNLRQYYARIRRVNLIIPLKIINIVFDASEKIHLQANQEEQPPRDYSFPRQVSSFLDHVLHARIERWVSMFNVHVTKISTSFTRTKIAMRWDCIVRKNEVSVRHGGHLQM